MSSYCNFASGDPLHGPYHDREYGFPESDEAVLFERMVLEIMQAGLNWTLILNKRPAFREAFEGFNVDHVASYGETDRNRLLADATIVRNHLKIDATIHNARQIQLLRESHGGFAGWIAVQQPSTKDEWVKCFRKQFKFMGGEICGEFLMSIGYLPGAHREDCPIFAKIAKHNPAWIQAKKD